MRRIILVVMMMVIGVSSSWKVYGQTNEEKRKMVDDEMRKLQKMAEQKEEPQEVRDFVKQSIVDIESSKNDSLKLNRLINNLETQLMLYHNSNIYLAPQTKQNITKTLIKIFYSIDDVSTNSANRIRIIETIGHFLGNSIEDV